MDQADFGFTTAPAQPTPVRTLEPVMTAAKEEEPLFAPSAYNDDRQKKGGWLSLFSGRPRQDPTHASRYSPPRSGGAAVHLAQEPLDEAEADEAEDLEIPSFLRRLAN